jgi:endonuclease III
MPRESKLARSKRLALIIDRLQNTYPDAHCELHHSNPLELLVATILSAQANDKQVNLVTQHLFHKYRSASDYAAANLPELEQDIRRLGFFRHKARNIQRACQILIQRHNGQVPNSMQDLIQLDGVGRKTANVVLGNAFNLNEGIVVDTHVSRLALRLGLTSRSQPEKIEQDLLPQVPRKFWSLFSHWLIWHGRRRCTARKPDCPRCELRQLCPSAHLFTPQP